jgi:hypothetical protein
MITEAPAAAAANPRAQNPSAKFNSAPHRPHHQPHHGDPRQSPETVAQQTFKGANWTPPTSPQSSSTNQPQVEGTNPLIELLRQQASAGQQQQQAAASGNPLLFTLTVMSLIISVALVALLVLGSSAPSYGRPSPLDK